MRGAFVRKKKNQKKITKMTKNNLNKLILSTISIILLVRELNAQYDSNDYMKREHSLVKPYQGKSISQTIKKIT